MVYPPPPMRKLVLSEISCGNTPPPSCRMSATMIPKILHQTGLRLTKKAAIGPKRAGNELSADNSIFRPKITFIFGQNNCRMGVTTLRKKSAKMYLKGSQKRWGWHPEQNNHFVWHQSETSYEDQMMFYTFIGWSGGTILAKFDQW